MVGASRLFELFKFDDFVLQDVGRGNLSQLRLIDELLMLDFLSAVVV